MKLNKNILSIMLVIVLITTGASTSIASASGTDYNSALVRAYQLGIISDSTNRADEMMTRGQFVKALVIASGLEDEVDNFDRSMVFPDIDSDSELKGYVNIAVNKGFIRGMIDGYFHPEAGVTYAEACTIAVKLLGYNDEDVKGLWPSNYINKARDLDITKDMNLKRNDKITIGTAAIIFDRLLDTNVKGTSNKKLSEALDVYNEYILQDNSISSTSLHDNQLLTDKGILYFDRIGNNLEIGSKYRIKAKDENITKVYGKVNDTVRITVDNIVDNTIYYKVNEKLEAFVLPSNPTYYYHGEKQNFANLNKVIKTNMTVSFIYNKDKTGFDSAVIIDGLYSKPEVAYSFNPSSDKIGNIILDENTRIIKNGKTISKNEIEELDVVYDVTDINGKNRCVLVYNDRAEGDIKKIISSGSAPVGIQIDGVSYTYGKDMDLNKVAGFKEADKIAALLGHDGKVIDLTKVEYKTQSERQIIVLGNSDTSRELAFNQVRTDKGVYYYLPSLQSQLEVGAKYTVSIDEDTISKVKEKENLVNSYGILSKNGSTIVYGEKEKSKAMVLPEIATYYYKDAKKDYNTVIKEIQPCTTVILAIENGVYAYGVVIDPIYSTPVINSNTNETMAKFKVEDYLYIYRDGKYLDNLNKIDYKDVVYSVTDMNSNNKYIYVNNSSVFGKMTAILPNRINPKSVEVGGKTYQLSKDFDYKIMNKDTIAEDYYVTLVFDVYGEVIDIYQ